MVYMYSKTGGGVCAMVTRAVGGAPWLHRMWWEVCHRYTACSGRCSEVTQGVVGGAPKLHRVCVIVRPHKIDITVFKQ